MMFYWLDNFTHCLPPFFHEGVVQTMRFLTYPPATLLLNILR
jgi:hypothetical protein